MVIANWKICADRDKLFEFGKRAAYRRLSWVVILFYPFTWIDGVSIVQKFMRVSPSYITRSKILSCHDQFSDFSLGDQSHVLVYEINYAVVDRLSCNEGVIERFKCCQRLLSINRTWLRGADCGLIRETDGLHIAHYTLRVACLSINRAECLIIGTC